MLETYDEERLTSSEPGTMGAQLEAGKIIHFPSCPIELPPEHELATLREQLPKQLKLKNISYHPEAGTVRGLEKDSPVADLVKTVLVNHSNRVSAFLRAQLPGLFDHALIGTCSFRPIEEQGRNLKAHASNELIHIDAGAYGATNGDRILRFFVNVNPTKDRVWVTRGAFPELFAQYRSAAGLDDVDAASLRKGALDNVRTGILHAIDKLGTPVSRALDSSPYDRAMRRFHNFMKDTPDFQAAPEGRLEMRFAPMSAWMVLTDMVSHACLSGQHCLNYTALIPLEDCQRPELAPYNILAGAARAAVSRQ
jgi:hypothetical protein